MSQQQKNTEPKRDKLAKCIAYIVLVLICAAVAVAVTIFFTKSLKNKGTTDFGDYIAVFSVLITMIAVILPLSTYFINKDEVKKLSDEFDKKLNELQSANTIHNDSIDRKIGDLDYRYVEIFESLIKRKNIDYKNMQTAEDRIYIDYINALNLFEEGAYNACRIKLEETVRKLDSLPLAEKKNDLTAILIFKIFNLYRKLAGRMRTYGGDWLGVLQRIVVRYQSQKSDIVYRVSVYIYVRICLDEVEKTFDCKDDPFFEELHYLTETIKSDTLYYYALKAKYHYVLAYFTQKDRTENYNKANLYATYAYKEAIIECTDKQDDELYVLLGDDSKFTVAKVLEKISFGLQKEDRKKALRKAEELTERLIVSVKTDPKYYLELSEILKKQGRRHESNYAAQYGFQLAPTDPLLAAQCAYIYLHAFFGSEERENHYLLKAEECIETAYWIYQREKQANNDKVNVRFSYIASLYSVIKMCMYVQYNKTDNDNLRLIFGSMNSSIKDNENNVPNYKRALIVCIQLYNHGIRQYIGEKSQTIEVMGTIRTLVKDYCENKAFVFSDNEAFHHFTQALQEAQKIPDDESLLKTLSKILQPFADHI